MDGRGEPKAFRSSSDGTAPVGLLERAPAPVPATTSAKAPPPETAQRPLAEEEQLRAQLYDFLSALLGAVPTKERLSQIGALDGDDTEIGAAVTALAHLAGRLDRGAVDREFHKLFIGLGRGELLPYASFYLTGFLNEKPLAKLRDDMARLGIARDDTVKEPEDNIASLCEMMAGLIDGRFGTPVDLETQQQFFNAHIAPWAAHFFTDLERAETAVFYVPVGTLGRLLVEIDREAFRMTR